MSHVIIFRVKTNSIYNPQKYFLFIHLFYILDYGRKYKHCFLIKPGFTKGSGH